MISEHDPIEEPLRLLRETKLAAGFDERLAERLAVVHREGTTQLFHLRIRGRVLMLVAAIALPAAAAATGYYVQQRPKAVASDSTRQLEPKPLPHLSKDVYVVDTPVVATVAPTLLAPPTPLQNAVSQPEASIPKRSPPTTWTSRPQATPTSLAKQNAKTASAKPALAKDAERRSSRSQIAQASNARPAAQMSRIEVLDPFASKTTTQRASTTNAKSDGVRASLLKAHERGTTRVDDDRGRDSRRDGNYNERRDHDRAQQNRERTEVRERTEGRERRGQ